MGTNSKHTEGEMYLDSLKWAEETPLAGFILKVGSKQICGFNFVAVSAIITDENAKFHPTLLESHFTAAEQEANANRIVEAWNTHDNLYSLLKRYYQQAMYPDTTEDYFESHWKEFCKKQNIPIHLTHS